ncbi:MAG: hypothetical protein RJA36_1471 [Pseudomonadota bacterium]
MAEGDLWFNFTGDVQVEKDEDSGLVETVTVPLAHAVNGPMLEAMTAGTRFTVGGETGPRYRIVRTKLEEEQGRRVRRYWLERVSPLAYVHIGVQISCGDDSLTEADIPKIVEALRKAAEPFAGRGYANAQSFVEVECLEAAMDQG